MIQLKAQIFSVLLSLFSQCSRRLFIKLRCVSSMDKVESSFASNAERSAALLALSLVSTRATTLDSKQTRLVKFKWGWRFWWKCINNWIEKQRIWRLWKKSLITKISSRWKNKNWRTSYHCNFRNGMRCFELQSCQFTRKCINPSKDLTKTSASRETYALIR